MRVLLRLGLLLLFVCLHSGAFAQINKNKVEIGVGVICDTAEQMQRYLILYKGETSPAVAMRSVNSESSSRGACGMASIMFVVGKHIGSVDVSGGTMRIIQITVIAMKIRDKWLDVPPTEQYTAFFQKLDEA